MNDTTPVVMLLFANDRADPLNNIRRERQGVFAALRAANDRGSIKVYKEEETSTEQLIALLRDYDGRVAIFHYGGHASATGLRMESADGAAELAHADGLALLLGPQTGLQLVFLNGCATQGQVAALLAAGVRAVIATAVPIDDVMATEFAEQFYLKLGAGGSIGAAFGAARAFIATRYGAGKVVGTFRGGFNAAKTGTVDAELTWGLYLAEGADAVLDWVVPDRPENRVIIRGAPPPAKGGVVVNAGLIAATLTAIAPFSLKVRQALEIPPDSDDYDQRIFPQLIMDSFPAPIGEQLRKLFAGDRADRARLRQLVVTYETVARLFAFAGLSQLWNARFERTDLVIEDGQWAVLNSFMALTAESQPVYDYLGLVTVIVDILAANGIDPFMAEFAGLTGELTDAPTTAARAFMDELRGELHAGQVPDAEVESFCVQAEAQLAVLLADFAFVVKYKFATVKNIDTIKSRHKAAKYVMRQIWLDRVTAGLKDDFGDYATFTDSESVILQKDRKNVAEFLNLTPFVIDENALTGDNSSKLFFYDFHDEANNFHYVAINDFDDKLVVSDDKYPTIKAQCGEFRDTVYSSRTGEA